MQSARKNIIFAFALNNRFIFFITMEEKHIDSNPPEHYLFCANDNCEKADNCLRRLAEKYGLSKDAIMQMVNPQLCCGNSCRYYREKKIVRMAYGMKQLYEKVLAKDIASMRYAVNSHFGNGSYYKRRNGKQPITPKEQLFVDKVFKVHGYAEGAVFDRYADEPEW